MSSQCKGTTKSGSPCKITIVLPNGYCRVHQDQYVVEIKEDTKITDDVSPELEKKHLEESVSKEESENDDAKNNNSISYVSESSCCKRWVIVPVLIMAALWIIARLLKQKDFVKR